MGFAQHTHDTYQNSNFTQSNLTLFRFKVSADTKSPDGEVPFNFGTANNPQQKNIYGHYEVVHFLNEFNKAPIIMYHSTNKEDKVLCADTFPDLAGNCPACAEYEATKDLYSGMDYEVKKKKQPIQAKRASYFIPVYVPRRVTEKHIHKGKTEILPIYWFELSANTYPEDSIQSFNRLKSADQNLYPIHKTPYVVLQAPKIGKYDSQQWYFLPTGYAQQYAIHQNVHPLLNYINPQTLEKVWGQDYFEMLEYLPILGFKQYFDSTTGQAFEYGGEYAKALNYYHNVKKTWPPASVKLAQSVAPQVNFGAPVATIGIPIH